MKQLRKCSICKEHRPRILLGDKFVDTSHNEWKDDNTCPNCKVKQYPKSECKGCSKSFSVHFEGKQYCTVACKRQSEKD